MNKTKNKVSKVFQTKISDLLEERMRLNEKNGHGYIVRDGDWEEIILSKTDTFAGNSRRSQSVMFKGTDMTIHHPTLPFRARGNKKTYIKYDNVITEELTNARTAWNIRTKPIYDGIVREFALTTTKK